MKNKLIELNVDSIGDGKPLTKDEEIKISEFIKNHKDKISKKVSRPKAGRKTKENV